MTNYRFTTLDSTFVLTQKQLDSYLDSSDPAVSEHWYDMLDSAVYCDDDAVSMIAPKSVTQKSTILSVNSVPVVDWDKEWAEVAQMMEEFSTPLTKKETVKRVTRAKTVKVETTMKSRKAQCLEYIQVSGDYTPGKFRTALKRSVYASFLDLDTLKLNTTEGWDTVWQAIRTFQECDVDSRERLRYTVRIANMKVQDLKQECKNLGLDGYGKLKKDELIQFILTNQA